MVVVNSLIPVGRKKLERYSVRLMKFVCLFYDVVIFFLLSILYSHCFI